MKKIHVRLYGFTTRDTTHPEFMDNLKGEIQKVLREKGVFQRPWVKEIIIGSNKK